MKKLLFFFVLFASIGTIYFTTRFHPAINKVNRPGADPGQIKIQFTGNDSLFVDEDGNLRLLMDEKEIIFKKPIIYQVKNNTRERIVGNYRLTPKGIIEFLVENYNPQLALVIDPVLSYATYLGGSQMERIGAIKTDY